MRTIGASADENKRDSAWIRKMPAVTATASGHFSPALKQNLDNRLGVDHEENRAGHTDEHDALKQALELFVAASLGRKRYHINVPEAQKMGQTVRDQAGITEG